MNLYFYTVNKCAKKKKKKNVEKRNLPVPLTCCVSQKLKWPRLFRCGTEGRRNNDRCTVCEQRHSGGKRRAASRGAAPVGEAQARPPHREEAAPSPSAVPRNSNRAWAGADINKLCRSRSLNCDINLTKTKHAARISLPDVLLENKFCT